MLLKIAVLRRRCLGWVYRAQQKADEIVQFAIVQPVTVISWHQRCVRVFKVMLFRFFHQVEGAILGLKLHGEIILIPDEPFESIALDCG